MKKALLIAALALVMTVVSYFIINRESSVPAVGAGTWNMDTIVGRWKRSSNQSGADPLPATDASGPGIIKGLEEFEISEGRKPAIVCVFDDGAKLTGRIELSSPAGLVAHVKTRDGVEVRIRITRTKDPARVLARDEITTALFDQQ